MTSVVYGGIVLVCLFGASMLAMLLRDRLPQNHLSDSSRDAIKLATAVVGTLAALALSLMIAQANTTFENAQAELKESAAKVVLLDRAMSRYGPETAEARKILRELVETRLATPWAETDEDSGATSRIVHDRGVEPIQDELRALTPATDSQRWLIGRALEITSELAEEHWMLVETRAEGLPLPFFAVMVFWLALLFGSFGLLAPTNMTVVVTIFVCVLSVAGAVFLLIDMAHPYRGLIFVSDAPLRTALAELGR